MGKKNNLALNTSLCIDAKEPTRAQKVTHSGPEKPEC